VTPRRDGTSSSPRIKIWPPASASHWPSRSGKALGLARINKLTEDVRQDPFTGIGKPGPLKYHLPGAWSRRIGDEHRLVYVGTAAEIIILAARYRY
jgi:toxin YoeB